MSPSDIQFNTHLREKKSALLARLASIEAEAAGIRKKLAAIDVLAPEAGDVDDEPSYRPLTQSLRETIRQAAVTMRDGFKPRELTAILEKNGAKVSSDTPLATRVSTEVWRLAKIGFLEKRGDRYFAKENPQ